MSDRPDARALLDALATGDLSAVTATEERLDALHRIHEETHAVAWFEDDVARAAARRLDEALGQSGPVGPLHGLPITVKDWIDVAGFPCAGVGGDPGRRPERDATVVARLRAAGAVVVAKTAAWGPTDGEGSIPHPFDSARIPGGSSTGEAVLVARGASVLGVGSDSGGSIRLPAAWCGVVGHKPTAGLVPTTGHFPRVGPMGDGRTQIGPICGDVDLAALVLEVVAGPDGRDGGVAPVPLDAVLSDGRRPTTFAVVTDEGPWTCDPEVLLAVEQGASAFDAAGLERVEWRAPWLDDARDITERYWRRSELTGADAAQQLDDWDRFRARYMRASVGVDLIVTPTVREVAPLARQILGDDFVYTLPASLTGSPALTVPVDTGSRLPGAVQIVGRPWQDGLVLAAGRVIEALSRT